MLHVLSFSGGKQSTCILEMVLRGEIVRPKHFVVLNANPGMENSNTYRLVKTMRAKCLDAGIHFETVKGPNLYDDLIALKDSPSRIDNPPYWTVDANGKRGMLRQECTQRYKIAPMDRALRRIMWDKFRIPIKSRRIPRWFVVKWIGFAADEKHRVSTPRAKYQRFKYPLIEAGMTTTDVVRYFQDRGLTVPDRSVCNGCFANGLSMFKEMAANRPHDFEQAVAVDEAIRHGLPGVTGTAYVSSTCIPLRVLKERGFNLGDPKENDKHACQSGHCFL